MGISFDTKKKRKYMFKTRWLDGIAEDTVEANNVSDAYDVLAKQLLAKQIDIDIDTLLSITASVEVYNPIKKEWVDHKPWWVEEKELYDWEK